MHINRALRLKVGDVVRCPSDRGDPPYSGKVTHISPVRCFNVDKCEYIWIEVQGLRQRAAWPSNRLG